MIGRSIVVKYNRKRATIVGIERDFFVVEYRDGSTERLKGFGFN